MAIHKKSEYEIIVNDIKYNESFLKLKGDIHHGTDKYAHCNRVAYLTYRISKFLKLDYKEATRAGMMHDFFYGGRNESLENSYANHPLVSAKNAKKIFNASEKEVSIIRTHMFPNIFLTAINPFVKRKNKKKIADEMPKSKEGWIICLADALVSAEEWGVYKVSFSLSILFLFVFNMLTMNK